MPEGPAQRTVVYWPESPPGVAQVQVAEFIVTQGSDDVLVIVGQSRQHWVRAQVDRVLAAFRQAGYTLEAGADQHHQTEGAQGADRPPGR